MNDDILPKTEATQMYKLMEHVYTLMREHDYIGIENYFINFDLTLPRGCLSCVLRTAYRNHDRIPNYFFHVERFKQALIDRGQTVESVEKLFNGLVKREIPSELSLRNILGY